MSENLERHHIWETESLPDKPIEFQRVKSRFYIPFGDARDYARQLKLKTIREWYAFCEGQYRIKKPHNVPKNPQAYYKNRGWVSWPDFLGKKMKKDQS